MQQHGSKYFARRPLPPPPDPGDGMGSIDHKSIFPEHGHSALLASQIKGNPEMQQHGSKYLPPPPPTLGDGVKRSKSNFFRTWSCCISNLSLREKLNAATR